MIEIILKALKKELFNINVEFPPNINWEDVQKEAQLQATDSLVYSGISKSGIEDEHFKKETVYQILKNTKSFMMHVNISKILEKAEIPYMIIKGVVSASYYPSPDIRPMGDTDVLVKREHLQKAFELFKKYGLETDKEVEKVKSGHHIDFKKGKQRIELHFDLPGYPDNEMAEEVKKLTSDIWENTKIYETPYGKIVGPSEFHHGLIMLLHMQEHMQKGGMGLRHLCDWAVFVNKYSDNEFLNLFEEKLKNIGLWRFACLLSQTSKYIGLTQKEWMGNDEELAKKLLEDIISCGNFGRKDMNRVASQKYVPVVGNEKKKKSQLGQYFDYGLKTTCVIWPFYKKHKWLLPIGFIGYCVRTGYRLITKKSKMYNLKDNNKVYDLYSQLKLFEK